MPEPVRAHLLTLPPEIRERIYTFLLHPSANKRLRPDEYEDYDYSRALALFKINRQIYIESRKIFRDLNIFVRVETPWPQSEGHVRLEGHVPVLVSGPRAASFEEYTMRVVIDAPENPTQSTETEMFVVLVDDLHLFCKVWFYADLSYPELNKFLRLTMVLQDPYRPSWDEKHISKATQRKLLMPFGVVKDLRELSITGDPKPFASIESELRREQAIPHPSVEHYLREATRLKVEGNSQLQAGRYDEALQTYVKAWESLHVVIKGRKRHIHGDAFFGRELVEPPFAGKNGPSERLILRVQLVANTCLVYLKQERWDEAIFWGMRSIGMLREAMGVDERHQIPPEDEAVLGFPAASEMGKIYYRTALAFKEIDDKAEARKLLKVASVYLPRDESVKREIAACALRLG